MPRLKKVIHKWRDKSLAKVGDSTARSKGKTRIAVLIAERVIIEIKFTKLIYIVKCLDTKSSTVSNLKPKVRDFLVSLQKIMYHKTASQGIIKRLNARWRIEESPENS